MADCRGSGADRGSRLGPRAAWLRRAARRRRRPSDLLSERDACGGWGFTVRTGCLGDLDGRDVMLCLVCARRLLCVSASARTQSDTGGTPPGNTKRRRITRRSAEAKLSHTA